MSNLAFSGVISTDSCQNLKLKTFNLHQDWLHFHHSLLFETHSFTFDTYVTTFYQTQSPNTLSHSIHFIYTHFIPFMHQSCQSLDLFFFRYSRKDRTLHRNCSYRNHSFHSTPQLFTIHCNIHCQIHSAFIQ